ncbi:hypothetical protein ACXR0O_13000 [Verrucomicrobiota bacterium sgz303538]
MTAAKGLNQSRALGLALSFLGGVVVCMGLWFGASGGRGNAESQRTSSRAVAPAHAQPAGIPKAEENSSGSPVNSPVVETGAGAVPQALNDEIRQLLIETLEAPEDERMSRLGILLGRLRRGGIASVQWIRDYLASASDLSQEALYGAKLAKEFGGYNLPTFRELLGQTLTEIAEANPSAGREIASAGIGSARTMKEALDFIQLGEKVTPGAMRDEAVAAVKRMFGEKLDVFDFSRGAGVMARFQAEELLPVVESALEKHPYEVSDFSAALWSLPDEKRLAATRRLLNMEGVREAMRINPHMCTQLDMREPEFRAAVVADFAAPKSEEQCMYLIRNLGIERESTSLENVLPATGEKPAPAPGQPGSKEQALAHLLLLDELEPYCTTSLLQQHLADSRERLTKFVNTP